MQKIINPDIRNFVNVTAHPAGCEANIRTQAAYTRSRGPGKGIGNVLVIGSSTGYGLASMLTAIFGYGANGVGVCFEKPAGNRRSATPGYYNVAALHKLARQEGRQVDTFNGDAFSRSLRSEVITLLKEKYGPLDYVIYSLASSRRQDPDSEILHRSCIKPIGRPYTTRTINLSSGEIERLTIEPATEEEIAGSVKVMGGEDWQLWIEALAAAGLLNRGCRSLAYTYVGSAATAAIYRDGTIGAAKINLEGYAGQLDQRLQQLCGGNAWVCSCQGLVTKASAVIPAMPLYLSLLKKAMPAGAPYETAQQQIVRLFTTQVAPELTPRLDAQNLIRLDDRELVPAVQEYILGNWDKVNSDNLNTLADFVGFKQDFLQSAGFNLDGVDYAKPVQINPDW